MLPAIGRWQQKAMMTRKTRWRQQRSLRVGLWKWWRRRLLQPPAGL